MYQTIENLFIYEMGDLDADRIYEDNKYVKLDSVDKPERYTYNYYETASPDSGMVGFNSVKSRC